MLRSLLVVLFCSSLISCSRTDLVLRFADDILMYEVSSLFDLNRTQKKELDVIADKFVINIKAELLPFFIRETEAASLVVGQASNLTVDEYQKNITVIMNRLESKLQSLRPVYLTYSAQAILLINEKNWQHFIEKFKDENTEILDKKSESKLEKNIENFFGKLTDKQKELITEFSKTYPYNPSERVKNRQLIIDKFQASLGSEFSTNKLIAVTAEWINQPEHFGDADVKLEFKKRREAVVELLAKLLSLKSKKQSENIVKQLNSYENDFRRDFQRVSN